MRRLARDCAPLTSLKLQSNRFGMLVHSILSQQISVHAARAVRGRLVDRIGKPGLTPDAIADLTLEELRAVGMSRTKAAYLHDLSEKVSSGAVALNRIGRKTDEDVIGELIQIKGIGVWTAQMFLIFSLGRLDVFPHDDYGIRSAIQKLYGLDDLPSRPDSESIAAPWRPYATIATWYLWRSHELGKAGSGGV
jgi:DNA-3-methyladenine glycosylase II